MSEKHLEAGENRIATFVRAGSIIHYWTYGRENAPAVVCTHGVTLDHGTYAGQVTALSEAGYRVITWDMRGHGLSRPMGESFSVRTAAEDLAALLDEERLDRAVLIGQSFGGSVVQELYRHHPQRIAALILVGAPALGDRPPWHQRIMQRTRPAVLRMWPEGHLRRTLPSFMSQRDPVRRYVIEATQSLSKSDLILFTKAALEALLKCEPLKKIDVPVLLVRGRGEMGMLVRMLEAWAERDPEVSLKIVEDAGHLANHDNPDAFNAILLDFLQRHRPAMAEFAIGR